MSEAEPKKSAMKIRTAYIVTAVAISSLMIGASFGMMMGATTPSIPTVIEPGSMVGDASYVIFKDGSTYFAKNGTTGQIAYSYSNFTTLFQQVLNERGGRISLRTGVYDLNLGGSIGIDKYSVQLSSSVTIEGENPRSTILRIANGANARIFLADSVMGITLRSLGFNGNYLGQTNAAGGQLDFRNSQGIHIDNCRFFDYYGTSLAFGSAAPQEYSSPNIVSNSVFENMGKVVSGAGVYVQGNNIIIENSYFANISDNAIGFEGVRNGYVLNNVIINATHLVLVNSIPGLHSENILISGNYVKDSARAILGFGGASSVDNLTIDKNIIQNTLSDTAIEVRGGVGHKITNNVISGSMGNGIALMANYTVVTGNLIYNNTAGGIDIRDGHHISIIGNAIHDNGGGGAFYCGIYLRNATNISILSNEVTNSYSTDQDYGIYEDVDSDFNSFIGNTLLNNRVADLVYVGGNDVLSDNLGFKNEAYGTIMATAGNVSKVFAHGLSRAPAIVLITEQNPLATQELNITYTSDATNIAIYFSVVLSQDTTFSWYARF